MPAITPREGEPDSVPKHEGQMPATAADPVAVLGRLLASPRNDTTAARARLDLLERMLRRGGAWWRAEDLADRGDRTGLDEIRTGLRELRKIGVIEWDERAQAFALRDGLRVPLALVMLAADEDRRADQAAQLDALIPFAQLAGRSGAHAPLWAMLDLVERDLAELERDLAVGESGVEHAARDRRLITHAENLRAAVERLAAVDDDSQASRDLLDHAVDVVNRAGEQIARMSVRMSRSGRDRVRLPGSRRSAGELRAALADLPAEELAACVAAQAGLAPNPLIVPAEDDLAALAALGAPGAPADTARAFPDAADLATPAADDEPAPPDPSHIAAQRLELARPQRMAEHLFGPLETWGDALRLHQGLIRLHGEMTRRGKPSWTPDADRVQLADGGPVSWLQEIHRSAENRQETLC